MPVVEIARKCSRCQTVVGMSVDAVRYSDWSHGGGHIQDMLPELNADERELLISGICGKCFDAMFDDDEDDE